MVRRFGRRETAYVHRDMLTLLRATPVWASDAPKSVQNELVAWTDQMIRSGRAAHAQPRATRTSPTGGSHNWQQQYYAENFARLVAGQDEVRPAQPVPQRAEHPRPKRPRTEAGGAGGRRLTSVR